MLPFLITLPVQLTIPTYLFSLPFLLTLPFLVTLPYLTRQAFPFNNQIILQELECARDPDSQKFFTGQTPAKISSLPELPTRPLKSGLEETTEAQTGPERLMKKPGTSSDNDFSGLHTATPKLADVKIGSKDNNKVSNKMNEARWAVI